MKKIIVALLICICFMSNAMADRWHGPRYYPRPYHDHFVAGVVTGAIIGGVIMSQPRPVYVQPVPVYQQPVQYVRQFDPNCNCWVWVAVPVYPGY